MPVQLSLMPVTIPHPVIEALPPAVERLGHMMVSLLIAVDGTFEILEAGVASQDVGIVALAVA
ncbi:hypothetical protein NXC12_CH02813 [Rhizobium etli]|uniref:Uncharacterized protein n=1 Tax=Rhizobium etli TaxID=29449 RepID=A0AAN1BI39_RHIET|nr:hypothetical protein NXC12_CH02813 [Rhizobium etli]